MAKDLTQQRLKQLLHYDPETGVFTWRVHKGKGVVGKQAGEKLCRNGYRQIVLDESRYQASHLAWFYVHGVLPVEMDHIDRAKFNDRIDNLRPASRSQNHGNHCIRKDNKLGVKGVHRHHSGGKYVAGIAFKGKRYNLGHYPTVEEAKAAYDEAAKKFFGDFACPG